MLLNIVSKSRFIGCVYLLVPIRLLRLVSFSLQKLSYKTIDLSWRRTHHYNGRTTEGRAMSLRPMLRWTHVQCEVCPYPWRSGRESKDFPSCEGNMSIPGWRCLLGARAAHPLRRHNIWTTTGNTRLLSLQLRGTISIPSWRCLLDARAARHGAPEGMEHLIRARILRPKLRRGHF